MKTKKWITEYIQSCCEVLRLDTENLDVSINPTPGGHTEWDGALLLLGHNEARLEISDRVRKSKYWKKVILHETIHYKMQYMDRAVKYRIINGYANNNRKYLKRLYVIPLENFVWEMVEVLYPVVESYNEKT
jgi:hypothetical protein